METWELEGYLSKSAYEANRESSTTYNEDVSYRHSINSEMNAANFNFLPQQTQRHTENEKPRMVEFNENEIQLSP
jgi:hypothetical protein